MLREGKSTHFTSAHRNGRSLKVFFNTYLGRIMSQEEYDPKIAAENLLLAASSE